jgi:O-antigen ligase
VTEAAPAGRAAQPVELAPDLRDLIPAVAVFAALVGTAFENGGFFPGAWTSATVAFLWLVAIALLLGVDLELTALELVWLGLLAAVVVWTAFSISWSLNARESAFEVRRDLVYVSAAAALLLLGTRRSAVHLVTAVWGAVSVVVVDALARYLLAPELRSDQFQVNLLFRPLGYANALGIFAGLGAVLAVALTARVGEQWLRSFAAASLAPLAAAVWLTSSRASALALVIGLLVMLALDGRRVDLVGAMIVTAPLVAVIVALSERADLATPTRAAGVGGRAHLLALSIVVGAAALACAPKLAEAVARGLTRIERRRLSQVSALIAAGVVVGVVLVGRGRVDTFFTTGYRPTYWHVAWKEAAAHPALGGGAGTFADYWSRYGDPNLQGGALDAHNLYLETLAELGAVGLVLLAAALSLPLLVALRHRSDPVAAPAAGAYAAFLVHAVVDWDWEMPTVTLAALACAAAVLLLERETAPVRKLSTSARTALLVLALGLAVAVLAAEFLPSLERPYP